MQCQCKWHVQCTTNGNWSEVFWRYLASSWFLLRQTREKPLRATVLLYFSIEHVQAPHAPRHTFDAKVHLSIIFSLEVFWDKRIKMYLTRSADERAIQFSLYFCYHFTKMTPLFKQNETLFLHDFYVCRLLIRLPTCWHKKRWRALAFIGSLCA